MIDILIIFVWENNDHFLILISHFLIENLPSDSELAENSYSWPLVHDSTKQKQNAACSFTSYVRQQLLGQHFGIMHVILVLSKFSEW